MKIDWRRTEVGVEGYVGEVLVFYIHPDRNDNQVQLTCDLPEAAPGLYGRSVSTYSTAGVAARHAAVLLKTWYERFTRNAG